MVDKELYTGHSSSVIVIHNTPYHCSVVKIGLGEQKSQSKILAGYPFLAMHVNNI